MWQNSDFNSSVSAYYYRLLNEDQSVKHFNCIGNRQTKMLSFFAIECKLWTVKQQYALLLPVIIIICACSYKSSGGPTPLYCYAIPVHVSIRSVIQLIYLIYRHESRKMKHENIKITHYDEWWIWRWCNKAIRKKNNNNNKFLITVFSLECRMPNAECSSFHFFTFLNLCYAAVLVFNQLIEFVGRQSVDRR